MRNKEIFMFAHTKLIVISDMQYTSCLITGKKWYHRCLPSSTTGACISFFTVLLLSILVMQLVPKEGKYSWLCSRNLSYCRGGPFFLEMYICYIQHMKFAS